MTSRDFSFLSLRPPMVAYQANGLPVQGNTVLITSSNGAVTFSNTVNLSSISGSTINSNFISSNTISTNTIDADIVNAGTISTSSHFTSTISTGNIYTGYLEANKVLISGPAFNTWDNATLEVNNTISITGATSQESQLFLHNGQSRLGADDPYDGLYIEASTPHSIYFASINNATTYASIGPQLASFNGNVNVASSLNASTISTLSLSVRNTIHLLSTDTTPPLELTWNSGFLYIDGHPVATDGTVSSISSVFWQDGDGGTIVNKNVGTGLTKYLVGIGYDNITPINATLDVIYKGSGSGNVLNVSTNNNNRLTMDNNGVVFITSSLSTNAINMDNGQINNISSISSNNLDIVANTIIKGNFQSNYDGELKAFTASTSNYLYIDSFNAISSVRIGAWNDGSISNYISLCLQTASDGDPIGNVGIGTLTPQFRLDVNGDVHTSGYLSTNTINMDTGILNMNTNGSELGQIIGLSTINGIAWPPIDDALWSKNGNDIYNDNTGGNVGIGTSNPTFNLQVSTSDNTALNGISLNYSDVNTIIGNYSAGSNNVGSIQVIRTSNSIPYSLWINPLGGDVIIGGTSTTLIKGTTFIENDANISTLSTNTINMNDGIITTNKLIVSSTNPTDNNGAFKVELTDANFLVYKSTLGSNPPVTVISNSGGGPLGFGVSNPNMFITGSYIGMGTSTPNEKLDVIGNIRTSIPATDPNSCINFNDQFKLFVTKSNPIGGTGGTSPSSLDIFSYFPNALQCLTMGPTGETTFYDNVKIPTLSTNTINMTTGQITGLSTINGIAWPPVDDAVWSYSGNSIINDNNDSVIIRSTLSTNYGIVNQNSGIRLVDGFGNSVSRPPITATNTLSSFVIHGGSIAGPTSDDGFLQLSAGGGTGITNISYIQLSGYSSVPDMANNIVFGTKGTERMRIVDIGYVGIGTSGPIAALEIENGNNIGSYYYITSNTDGQGRSTITIPTGATTMYFEMVGAGGTGGAGGGYIKGEINVSGFIGKTATIQVGKNNGTSSSSASFISFISDTTLMVIAGSSGNISSNGDAGGYGGGGTFLNGIANGGSGGTGGAGDTAGGGTTIGGTAGGFGFGVTAGVTYNNTYTDSSGGSAGNGPGGSGGNGYSGGGGASTGGGGGGSSYINTTYVTVSLSYNGSDYSSKNILPGYGRADQNGYVYISFGLPSLKTSNTIICGNNLNVNGVIISPNNKLYEYIYDTTTTFILSSVIPSQYNISNITYIRLVITAIGGGGGGGGSFIEGSPINEGFAGGGGGSGQENTQTYYVLPTTQLTITIGAGGTGGAISKGTPAGSGGTTTVISSDNIIKVSASGGEGAGNINYTNPDFGGNGYYGGGMGGAGDFIAPTTGAGNSCIAYSIRKGNVRTINSGQYRNGGNGDGPSGIGGTGGMGANIGDINGGGGGGSSLLGTGGNGGTTSAGSNGTRGGGGGGGGYDNGTLYPGGNGGNGCVQIQIFSI